MIDALLFVIDVPPQGKQRHRMARGRAYSEPAMVRFAHNVKEAAKAALRGREVPSLAVSLTLEYRLPVPESWSSDKRKDAIHGSIWPTVKPDIDNIEKGVLDGCNGVLWADDSYVVECHHSKVYSAEPCTLVSVTWMPGKIAQTKYK